MKISVDAGGFCTDPNRRYGNFIFTDNLIRALYNYDDNNKYLLYSFCPAPQQLLLRNTWKYLFLRPRKLWMKFRVSLEELIDKKDIFLCLNQAVPVFSRARIISFSHGLSYYFFPQYYRESFIRLSLQLTPMIKQSSYIVVSSEKVKEEMKIVYPDYKNIVVIPFGIPFDMLEIPNKKENSNPYFLYVGMNHPIKNLKFVIKAFKKFKSISGNSHYRLVLIGPQYMYSHKEDHIKVIPSVNREELKQWYRNATAYLTASLYESFNIPVLEALSQECPVIGLKTAIIPELTKYVNVVNSLNAFIECMSTVSINSNARISANLLKKSFSWKDYIKKLTKLYSI